MILSPSICVIVGPNNLIYTESGQNILLNIIFFFFCFMNNHKITRDFNDGDVIKNRFYVNYMIGCGAFGCVYLVQDLTSYRKATGKDNKGTNPEASPATSRAKAQTTSTAETPGTTTTTTGSGGNSKFATIESVHGSGEGEQVYPGTSNAVPAANGGATNEEKDTRLKLNLKYAYYALKSESFDNPASPNILKMEVAVIKALTNARAKHVCQLIARGKWESSHFVVMTLTHSSIQAFRRHLPGTLYSPFTTLRIGKQTVEALEELHSVGFIHRDIKPSNFSVGRKSLNENRLIYMLDFGLARRFLGSDGLIRTPRVTAGFRGTLRYASLYCHKGIDQGRRDDLESWWYMIAELFMGQLPWAKLKWKEYIMERKIVSRTNGELGVSSIPKEFSQLLAYIDSLKYVDIPDYKYFSTKLNAAISHLPQKQPVDPSQPFEWEKFDTDWPPPVKTQTQKKCV